VPVSGLGGVIAIAAGGAHSLALLRSGAVMAWGENTAGELGNGEGGYERHSTVPVAVSNLGGVKAISAGEEHSLALLRNGAVMAWGYNINGELGDGEGGLKGGPERCFFPGEEESFACSKIPAPVSGLRRVEDISAGAYHSLALLPPGSVVAWGFNGQGQLGNGTTENSDLPVAVSGLDGIKGIAAGGDDSFAFGPFR
jgi:alpha-tubulin suppressor-like RCC1 family protein